MSSTEADPATPHDPSSTPERSTGTIVRLWLKPHHGKPMQEIESATLVPGHGLEGNADSGPRRQVTLIEEELWQAAEREVGTSVDPSARRANILVRGISLADTRGKTLRIGGHRVEVAGETVPCRLMEETQSGLLEALRPDWRGGVFARVLDGGAIRIGDTVTFDDAD